MSNILNNQLKAIYEKYKGVLEYRGCVSAVKTNANTIHYAINGDDNNLKSINKKILIDFETGLKNIFSSRVLHKCMINDAITIITPMEYDKIVNSTMDMYKNYNCQSTNRVIQDFSNLVFPLKYGMYKLEYNRNWSCSERKIVGFLQSDNHFFYSTNKPCFLCFPLIKCSYYIDGGEIMFFEREKRELLYNRILHLECKIRKK